MTWKEDRRDFERLMSIYYTQEKYHGNDLVYRDVDKIINRLYVIKNDYNRRKLWKKEERLLGKGSANC